MAEQMKNMTPQQMNMMMRLAGFVQRCQQLWRRIMANKMLVVSLLLLLVALFMRWLEIV